MPDDLVTNLRLAARPTKPEQISQMRESGQGPTMKRITNNLLPLDGSRDMEGHLRLPFGDPTDPLHAAKWEHITSLRDGTAVQDGAFPTRVFEDASVTPTKLDRPYLEEDGGFVYGVVEVQSQMKAYSMANGFGTTFFRVIQRENTEGWLWA